MEMVLLCLNWTPCLGGDLILDDLFALRDPPSPGPLQWDSGRKEIVPLPPTVGEVDKDRDSRLCSMHFIYLYN